MMRRRGAEVPLADRPGYVAARLQHVGHRRLVERQAKGGVVGLVGRVVLVAEPLLVAAGEEAGPGRRAEQVRDVPAGAADARPGEGVEVRREDVFAPLEAGVGESEVV